MGSPAITVRTYSREQLCIGRDDICIMGGERTHLSIRETAIANPPPLARDLT
jgi:hypothetical protein